MTNDSSDPQNWWNAKVCEYSKYCDILWASLKSPTNITKTLLLYVLHLPMDLHNHMIKFGD